MTALFVSDREAAKLTARAVRAEDKLRLALEALDCISRMRNEHGSRLTDVGMAQFARSVLARLPGGET